MKVPTGFWIGHPGALLPLPDIRGELSRSADRSVAYKESAAGYRRAYLSARRAPLRQWKITIPVTRPDEAALLHDLLMETDPPYVWVDPWARVTNVLDPRTAGLENTVPVLARLGRQPLADGLWAATAGSKPGGGVVNIPPCPVVRELPVTVSAYLGSVGDAYVAAVFLNSNAAPIGSPVVSEPVTGLALLNRASVTVAVPPVGAVAVSLQITGASVIAHPAVTWTAELLEYGGGGGAAQVVVTTLDESFGVMGVTGAEARLADISFTVIEVG